MDSEKRIMYAIILTNIKIINIRYRSNRQNAQRIFQMIFLINIYDSSDTFLHKKFLRN